MNRGANSDSAARSAAFLIRNASYAVPAVYAVPAIYAVPAVYAVSAPYSVSAFQLPGSQSILPRMPAPIRPVVTHHANGVLDFVDSAGTMWTVSEIAGLAFSERLMSLLPHPERRSGWLLFESDLGDRRRLAPVPDDWRTYSSSALETCLRGAVPASSERRRRTDEVR